MTPLSVEEAATRLGCIHFQKAQTLGTIWKNRCSTDAQRLDGREWSGPYMLAIEAAYTALTGKPSCSELQSRPGARNGSFGAANVFRAHSQRERAHGQLVGRVSTT